MDVELVEKAMRKWCDTSKGKDKTMCYYMGVGDAEQVRTSFARPSRLAPLAAGGWRLATLATLARQAAVVLA